MRKLQKCNQIRSLTEEMQTMWLDRITEASVFKSAGRYGVIFRDVRDGGRCRSVAFLFDWVVVDTCFSE